MHCYLLSLKCFWLGFGLLRLYLFLIFRILDYGIMIWHPMLHQLFHSSIFGYVSGRKMLYSYRVAWIRILHENWRVHVTSMASTLDSFVELLPFLFSWFSFDLSQYLNLSYEQEINIFYCCVCLIFPKNYVCWSSLDPYLIFTSLFFPWDKCYG